MIWLLPHPLSLSSRDTLLIGGELNDLNGKKVGPSIFHSIFSGSMIFFFILCFYIFFVPVVEAVEQKLKVILPFVQG
jgi:hypothetical protein